MTEEQNPEDLTSLGEQMDENPDELNQFKAELEETLREKEQYKNMAQRAQADLVNYRRPAAQELSDAAFCLLSKALELATNSNNDVKETWIRAFAAYELAILRLRSEGLSKKVISMLKGVRKLSKYNLEFTLRFKIHMTLSITLCWTFE